MSDLLNSVDLALFDKMHSKAHCLSFAYSIQKST